jgi:hypothetical protein
LFDDVIYLFSPSDALGSVSVDVVVKVRKDLEVIVGHESIGKVLERPNEINFPKYSLPLHLDFGKNECKKTHPYDS